MENQVSVLFVCMGNICRSPTAHGVFRDMVDRSGLRDRIWIDSAGTHAYHVGEPPDSRALDTARRHGIEMSDLVARRAESADFHEYDYIIAMDQDNYHALSAICPTGLEDKLYLLMDFAPQARTREVPDPYFGGTDGFERVFDLVSAGARGLLEEIRRRHL